MAKRKNPYINYQAKQTKKAKPKGYYHKIHLKLAKRVHSDFKKMGIRSTWNESQSFASKVLYQKYKNVFISKIDLKEVDLQISQRIPGVVSKSNIPIKEIVEECGSVFRVPANDLLQIEWYDIGNALIVIPTDVKIRISGGVYGSTSIGKREEFDYHNSGISSIVNNIRNAVNNESGSDYIWNGIAKLVPDRKDDGNNCNYFIDFVLEINGESIFVGEKEIEQKEVFGLTEEEIKTRKLSKKQAEKESKIRRDEAKKKAAEARLENEKIEAAKKRKRAVGPPKEEKSTVVFNLDEALNRLTKEYDRGIWTVKEYKKERSRLINLAEKLSK